jgi:hypothetical protein
MMAGLPPEIAQLETELAELQEEAEAQIEATNDAVDAMGSEKSRLIVTISIIVLFGLALIGYGAWAVFGEAAGYICPDQAAEAARLCTSRWSETKGILEGIVMSALLPLVTLTFGYYFGKATGADA